MRASLYSATFMLLLAMCSISAKAAEPELAALGDPVPGASSATFFDLARAFVTDLQPDGMGWIGHTLDAKLSKRLDLETDWPEGLAIDGVETMALGSGENQRLAVLFDFGPLSEEPLAPAILALYTTAGEPQLLDAVDVGLDRETGLVEPGVLDLGDGAQAIISESSHWNSNQTYRTTSILLADANHLQSVDDILTLSERYCGLNRLQEPVISVEPEKTGGRAAIRVEVTLRDEKVEESCDTQEKPSEARTVSVVYHWNGATKTYEPDSQDIKILEDENEKRF
ncbi:hypothetical protein G6N76_00630 [Rhizobium daejeonense]|uniref:Uncharacterized protein n=1 Tax=Rhizobium daejeonense TaxID=240521 RepID=A0A6M1RVX2_9HYPH|nr:hypothetical protein [Rhizobium daejeonense]NGO62161.1 hypothetical protein [Rhizobium daejeonense]